MGKKCTLLALALIITVTAGGCGTNASTSNLVTESTEYSSMPTSIEQSAASQRLIIYIASLSMSLRATAEYSLSEDGELIRIKDTYVFDTSCKYYNASEEAIDFAAFASIISNNYSENNKLTKCSITANDSRLVSDVWIVD